MLLYLYQTFSPHLILYQPCHTLSIKHYPSANKSTQHYIPPTMWAPVEILDLRPRDRFHCIRLASACSLELALLLDGTHLHELPAAQSGPLRLFGSSPEQLDQAAAFLASHKYAVDRPSSYVDTDETWARLAADSPHMIETGPPLDATSAHRSLWRPCPFLLEQIDRIESSLRASSSEPTRVRFRCLDLGAGACRDGVFLASRGGWEVVSVDQDGVRRLARTALRHGVVDQVRYANVSFLNDGSIKALPSNIRPELNVPDCARQIEIPPEQIAAFLDPASGSEAAAYDLVLGIRFLCKALFPRAVALVRPGGFLLWTAFLEGAFRPFNAKKLLRPGELRRLMEGLGLVTVVDERAEIEDGRPLQQYLGTRAAAIAGSVRC